MTRDLPTQSSFDKLLAWLASDRETAGAEYETIRLRLMKIFGCHGCFEAEKLADETIDRVMSKIDWLVENYVGDPILYFCGVARNVLKEDLRSRANVGVLPTVLEAVDDSEETHEYDCLDRCMEELPQHSRSLVLAYYEKQGHAKIDHHKHLAEELEITLRALRLRVYHLRLQLRSCIETCLRQSPAH